MDTASDADPFSGSEFFIETNQIMNSDTLNTIGVIIALAISIAGFFINASRSKHQNNADDGSYVKTATETADMAIRARQAAEKRAAELERRYEERLAALEKRNEDLENLLSCMAYRVTFVVHTGEEPRIEKISVERFPNRRINEQPVAMERRKNDRQN